MLRGDWILEKTEPEQAQAQGSIFHGQIARSAAREEKCCVPPAGPGLLRGVLRSPPDGLTHLLVPTLSPDRGLGFTCPSLAVRKVGHTSEWFFLFFQFVGSEKKGVREEGTRRGKGSREKKNLTTAEVFLN